MDEARAKVKTLAAEYARRSEALGWFEDLYRQYRAGEGSVPWADLRPNPMLVEWAAARETMPGPKACVVGCGLGDDALFLREAGLDVTAFDIAPTAVELARERFPESGIHWTVANLLALPESFCGAFHFVFEAFTLQAIPAELRQQAFPKLFDLLAPDGALLLIARAREDEAPNARPPEGPPWPLTWHELQPPPNTAAIASVENFWDAEQLPKRRWRILYTRTE